MKKKNYCLFLSGAALLMLAGCTADEQSWIESAQVPVQLSVSQETTVTRAEDGLYTATTGFSGSENVEVYVNSSDKHATFTVGTPDATTHQSSLTGTLYYPTTGDANLYAVYPASSTSSHTVNYDQTTAANYKASDLMYAKKTVTQANKASTQNLEFSHQLVKLKVIIIKAADVSQVTQVKMKNVKRKATVGLTASGLTLSGITSATGESGTGANADEILIAGSQTTSTSAVTYTFACVFPAQSWSNTDFIEVTADGKALACQLTRSEWTAGAEYTLTINVNAAALGTSVSITGWSDSNPAVTVNPTVVKNKAVITPTGAIPGLFTVDGEGTQVFFSKGNLQLSAANTWKFADYQWNYYGSSQTDNHRDLFGWGTGNNPNQTSTTASDYSTFTDWGNNSSLQSSLGSGWRTLTKDEWTYLFGTNSSRKRSTTSGVLFAKAQVNDVNGVILLSDDWSTSYHTLASTNTTSAAFTTNTITSAEWTSDFEAHGAVFLPAAGYRGGSTVYSAGSVGYYWSSTPYPSGADSAYGAYFNSGNLDPASLCSRFVGYSVRLVRQVE